MSMIDARHASRMPKEETKKKGLTGNYIPDSP